MITNCLDYNHRGQVSSGGYPGYASGSEGSGSFPRGPGYYQINCHPGGAWPNNYWNVKTPW